MMADGPIVETRKRDPLLGCIGQLAERFGVSFAPAMLASLARDENQRLPMHQAEPALELLGLNCDAARPGKLPRQSSAYPAIVALKEQDPVVVHELREGQVLVWRPESGAVTL